MLSLAESVISPDVDVSSVPICPDRTPASGLGIVPVVYTYTCQ